MNAPASAGAFGVGLGPFSAAVTFLHARYDGQIAVFAIEPLEILRGSLPGRAERLVREWALLHQAELMRNWEHARAGEPLEQIEALQ